MLNIRIKNEKGFSMMEVIFAVGIVSVSFVTLMSLFAHNIKMEINSRNKIVASYLAQESIEILRHKRDNNWFKGVSWLTDIPTDDEHKIVAMKNAVGFYEGWDVVNAANEDREKVFMYNNYYLQSNGIPNGNWEETSFRRYLEIYQIDSNSVKIISHVEYDSGEVEIVSYLYDGWH